MQVRGAEYARSKGADEGLWLNTRGHLAEGCTSNVFLAERRRLFTPAVRDGVLPGVVRGLVLKSARDLGFVIHEGKIGSLRRFKEDASEVRSGFDCGIGLERFQDVKPGDLIEAYVQEEVAPSL